jgi:hypothetical protein
MAEASNQPEEPVRSRASFVAKPQRTVFDRKLGNQLACCRVRTIDLPEIALLSTTAVFGNCYGIL